MPAIYLDQVSFHYDAPFTSVFEGLSVTLDADWKTALVGRNGKGKTTLMGLLQKRLEPARGHVHMPLETRSFPFAPGRADRPTLEVVRDSVAPFAAWEQQMQALLERGDAESLAAYGDLVEQYETMGGYDIDARIERELALLHMDPGLLKRRFDTLSGGEQTRTLIIGLFLRPDTFPLIDEPTNHLDAEGRDRLGRYLATQRGFLLASHDRRFIDLCADHVLSLNRGDVRVNHGDYSTWKAQMDLELEHEQRRHARLKREVRSLERSAQRRRTWSGAKEAEKFGCGVPDRGHVGHCAAKQMKRALSIERRAQEKIAEKKSLLKNAEKQHTLKLQRAQKTPERLLTLDRVTLSMGGKTLIRDLSLTIHKGERVAFVGPNGCGKTTLLRAIAGEIAPDSGVIRMASRLDWVRAYQTPKWQRGLLTDHLRDERLDARFFRAIMGAFGVVGDVFDRPLETFSQGERKKVDLCRSFLAPAHLLIWDEPLNYVDINSREQIEALLLEHAPTLLFVEHDQVFIDTVATRVIRLG